MLPSLENEARTRGHDADQERRAQRGRPLGIENEPPCEIVVPAHQNREGKREEHDLRTTCLSGISCSDMLCSPQAASSEELQKPALLPAAQL